MNIGDKCEAVRGWEVLAIRDNCPVHGCERYDLRNPGIKWTRRNMCPLCFKEDQDRYARKYRHRVRSKPFHDSPLNNVGIKANREFLWTAKNDRLVDKFWAERGMTEEESQMKFCSGVEWRKMVAQRKQERAYNRCPDPTGRANGLESHPATQETPNL